MLRITCQLKFDQHMEEGMARNAIRTSRGVARTASKVLSNPHSSRSAKRLAASTLSNRGR